MSDKYDKNKYPTMNPAWVELWGTVEEKLPAEMGRIPWRVRSREFGTEFPLEIADDANSAVAFHPEVMGAGIVTATANFKGIVLAVNNYSKMQDAYNTLKQDYAELLEASAELAQWPDCTDGIGNAVERVRQAVAKIRGEEIRYVRVYPRDDSQPKPHGPTACAVIEINKG